MSLTRWTKIKGKNLEIGDRIRFGNVVSTVVLFQHNKYPHDPTLNHTLVITKGMFTTEEKSFRLDPDHSYTILRRSINKDLSTMPLDGLISKE